MTDFGCHGNTIRIIKNFEDIYVIQVQDFSMICGLDHLTPQYYSELFNLPPHESFSA